MIEEKDFTPGRDNDNKVESGYYSMPVIFCKECRESIYLNPHAY
jgi:hypothetical protein